MSATERLFVYGTLREGGGAPQELRRLLDARTTRVGTGVVRGRLLDVGAFPAAVLDGEGEIRGEVLALAEPDRVLRAVDRYEGYGGPGDDLFERALVRVRMDEGGVLGAWAYVFTKDAGTLPEVPSGDWLRRQRRRKGDDAPGRQNPVFDERSIMSLRLQSDAFDDGERIPGRHTCEGEDVSPPLAWEGVPEGTASLALVVDDPDAPGTTWIHWVLYRLSPDRARLPEDVAPTEELGDGVQGVNDFGDSGWGGPCPPPGDGPHTYRFRLFALDVDPGLGPGASEEEMVSAVEGHVLAETVLTGTYSR